MTRRRPAENGGVLYDALAEALLATHRAKQGRSASPQRTRAPVHPSPSGGPAGYDRARGLMMRLEQVVSQGHGSADEFATGVRRQAAALNAQHANAPVIRLQARRGTQARGYFRFTNHDSTPTVIEFSSREFCHSDENAKLPASTDPDASSLECGESIEVCVSVELPPTTPVGTYLSELSMKDESCVAVFELRVYG